MKNKRERIVESAIKLFSTKGFQATSTTSITQNAGVGTGTLFLYFNSKEELINQIYLEVKAELAIHSQKGIGEENQLRGKFFIYWKNLFDWALNNPLKFQFIQQFSSSPFINNLTRDEAISGFCFIFLLLEEGMTLGLFRQTKSDFLYYIFNGQIFGTFNYLMSIETGKDEAIDESFQMVWRSILV